MSECKCGGNCQCGKEDKARLDITKDKITEPTIVRHIFSRFAEIEINGYTPSILVLTSGQKDQLYEELSNEGVQLPKKVTKWLGFTLETK